MKLIKIENSNEIKNRNNAEYLVLGIRSYEVSSDDDYLSWNVCHQTNNKFFLTAQDQYYIEVVGIEKIYLIEEF